MKTNIKKTLKLVTLLVISLLIATASAAIYNSMFLYAGVGVEGLNLAWDNTGIDNGLTATIQGATCTLSGLKAPIGGNRSYTKAIGISATADTTFDIEVVDVTGDTSNLNYIFVQIYDDSPSTTLKGNLSVWQNGAKGNTPVTDLSITNGDAWRFQWHIAWKTSAETGNSVTVSLKITEPSP